MTAEPREFRFQRFSLSDDACGMKIGTDGILLGAWVDCKNVDRILDVGTGCGLIALMLAQRTEAIDSEIVAIELDPSAAAQAATNVERSPWAARVTVKHRSLQEFAQRPSTVPALFDLIVCNPPFYTGQLPSVKAPKRDARHAGSLSLNSLFAQSIPLLRPNGRLALVLPFDQLQDVLVEATKHGYYLHRQTNVRPLPDRPVKRVLLEFGTVEKSVEQNELTLETTHHHYTDEVKFLTRDFYLRWADSFPALPRFQMKPT